MSCKTILPHQKYRLSLSLIALGGVLACSAAEPSGDARPGPAPASVSSQAPMRAVDKEAAEESPGESGAVPKGELFVVQKYTVNETSCETEGAPITNVPFVNVQLLDEHEGKRYYSAYACESKEKCAPLSLFMNDDESYFAAQDESGYCEVESTENRIDIKGDALRITKKVYHVPGRVTKVKDCPPKTISEVFAKNKKKATCKEYTILEGRRVK